MKPSQIAMFGLAFLSAIFLLPEVADACPNCKDGLHANYLAVAFGASVLLMMAMPFALLVFWTIVILRSQEPSDFAAPSLLTQSPSNHEPQIVANQSNKIFVADS